MNTKKKILIGSLSLAGIAIPTAIAVGVVVSRNNNQSAEDTRVVDNVVQQFEKLATSNFEVQDNFKTNPSNIKIQSFGELQELLKTQIVIDESADYRFSFKVNPYDSATAELPIEITIRRGNITRKIEIRLSGFLSNQEFLDNELAKITVLNLKTNVNASTTKPSEITNTNLNDFIEVPTVASGISVALSLAAMPANDADGTLKVVLKLSKDDLEVTKNFIVSGFQKTKTDEELVDEEFERLSTKILNTQNILEANLAKQASEFTITDLMTLNEILKSENQIASTTNGASVTIQATANDSSGILTLDFTIMQNLVSKNLTKTISGFLTNQKLLDNELAKISALNLKDNSNAATTKPSEITNTNLNDFIELPSLAATIEVALSLAAMPANDANGTLEVVLKLSKDDLEVTKNFVVSGFQKAKTDQELVDEEFERLSTKILNTQSILEANLAKQASEFTITDLMTLNEILKSENQIASTTNGASVTIQATANDSSGILTLDFTIMQNLVSKNLTKTISGFLTNQKLLDNELAKISALNLKDNSNAATTFSSQITNTNLNDFIEVPTVASGISVALSLDEMPANDANGTLKVVLKLSKDGLEVTKNFVVSGFQKTKTDEELVDEELNRLNGISLNKQSFLATSLAQQASAFTINDLMSLNNLLKEESTIPLTENGVNVTIQASANDTAGILTLSFTIERNNVSKTTTNPVTISGFLTNQDLVKNEKTKLVDATLDSSKVLSEKLQMQASTLVASITNLTTLNELLIEEARLLSPPSVVTISIVATSDDSLGSLILNFTIAKDNAKSMQMITIGGFLSDKDLTDQEVQVIRNLALNSNKILSEKLQLLASSVAASITNLTTLNAILQTTSQINPSENSAEIAVSASANDTNGSLILNFTISKNMASSTLEVTISGFLSTKMFLNDLLSTITKLNLKINSNAETTKPSEVTTTTLENFVALPTIPQGVSASLSLDQMPADDSSGTLKVILTLTKDNITSSNIYVVSNFAKTKTDQELVDEEVMRLSKFPLTKDSFLVEEQNKQASSFATSITTIANLNSLLKPNMQLSLTTNGVEVEIIATSNDLNGELNLQFKVRKNAVLNETITKKITGFVTDKNLLDRGVAYLNNFDFNNMQVLENKLALQASALNTNIKDLRSLNEILKPANQISLETLGGLAIVIQATADDKAGTLSLQYTITKGSLSNDSVIKVINGFLTNSKIINDEKKRLSDITLSTDSILPEKLALQPSALATNDITSLETLNNILINKIAPSTTAQVEILTAPNDTNGELTLKFTISHQGESVELNKTIKGFLSDQTLVSEEKARLDRLITDQTIFLNSELLKQASTLISSISDLASLNSILKDDQQIPLPNNNLQVTINASADDINGNLTLQFTITKDGTRDNTLSKIIDGFLTEQQLVDNEILKVSRLDLKENSNAANTIPSTITNDNLNNFIVLPAFTNDIQVTVSLASSMPSNDENGTLMVVIKLTKGEQFAEKTLTVFGFQKSKTDQQLVDDEAQRLIELLFENIKVLPLELAKQASQVAPNIKDLSSLNQILRLNDQIALTMNGTEVTIATIANDLTGALTLTFSVTKNTITKTIDKVINGFKTDQAIVDEESARLNGLMYDATTILASKLALQASTFTPQKAQKITDLTSLNTILKMTNQIMPTTNDTIVTINATADDGLGELTLSFTITKNQSSEATLSKVISGFKKDSDVLQDAKMALENFTNLQVVEEFKQNQEAITFENLDTSQAYLDKLNSFHQETPITLIPNVVITSIQRGTFEKDSLQLAVVIHLQKNKAMSSATLLIKGFAKTDSQVLSEELGKITSLSTKMPLNQTFPSTVVSASLNDLFTLPTLTNQAISAKLQLVNNGADDNQGTLKINLLLKLNDAEVPKEFTISGFMTNQQLVQNELDKINELTITNAAKMMVANAQNVTNANIKELIVAPTLPDGLEISYAIVNNTFDSLLGTVQVNITLSKIGTTVNITKNSPITLSGFTKENQFVINGIISQLNGLVTKDLAVNTQNDTLTAYNFAQANPSLDLIKNALNDSLEFNKIDFSSVEITFNFVNQPTDNTQAPTALTYTLNLVKGSGDNEGKATTNLTLNGFINNSLLNNLDENQLFEPVLLGSDNGAQFRKDFAFYLTRAANTITNYDTFDAQSKLAPHKSVYRIELSSFADGNNDGIGDLKGVQDKLKEIQAAGFDRLSLSSIFDSPSNSRNDVRNFNLIDAQLGTESDLSNLITAAKDLGIDIVIDLPLGFTSILHADFVQFEDDIKNEKANTLYSSTSFDFSGANSSNTDINARYTHMENNGNLFLVHIPGTPLDGSKLNAYYSHRHGVNVADLNFANTLNIKNSLDVARKYLNLGIKGFILPDIQYLVNGSDGSQQTITDNFRAALNVNAAFTRYFAALLNAEQANKGFYLATESALTTESALNSQEKARLATGSVVDNDNLFNELLSIFGNDQLLDSRGTIGNTGKPSNPGLDDVVKTIYIKYHDFQNAIRNYKGNTNYSGSNSFLDNANTQRLFSLIGNRNNQDSQDTRVSLIVNALATLMLLPDAPNIFYGSEFALNSNNNDLGNILPLPFTVGNVTKTGADNPIDFPQVEPKLLFDSTDLENAKTKTIYQAIKNINTFRQSSAAEFLNDKSFIMANYDYELSNNKHILIGTSFTKEKTQYIMINNVSPFKFKAINLGTNQTIKSIDQIIYPITESAFTNVVGADRIAQANNVAFRAYQPFIVKVTLN